ncbi:hypothetical protein D910_10053 [Dendroctonus ponderosae]|uniref:Retinoblastoma-associated protein A-box domain-containing protein n=1 Tax=Dendroctonus ponderosae TaxID=77166 RepID=U4UFI4_DENPD|nr:hypothetical protein D910_10053 [Dendroctonus ponderosae]
MVLSDDTGVELLQLHQELCSKLNLDSAITASSWDTYESISKKFVLEGEKIHWLGCAIYVASRGVETPTVDKSSVVKGMGINLTSLLRHSNLSFVQFFSNITRWSELAQLPDEFRTKIENLRNNFSIAYNAFKTYHPLFSEVFIAPVPNAQDLEAAKHRNRRNRAIPCTSLKIFEFVWNMFIILKAEEASCSKELINACHLLYCCIDLAFKNVLAAERNDLLNEKVVEELSHCVYMQDGRTTKETPCFVKRFCKYDSVVKEALHMKIYTFKQLVSKLVDSNVLIADEIDFSGIFDPENFDQNYRSIKKAYETHLLSEGDFDERIFMAEFKRMLLEKEQNSQNWTSMKVLPPGDSADATLMESPKVAGNPKGLDTPLTGRRFLGPRESDSSGKSTSERVAGLHTMLGKGNRLPHPSEELKKLFQSTKKDPLSKIEAILSKIKTLFLTAYAANGFALEEGQNRAVLATTLFYKSVEMILNKEKTITPDLSVCSALVDKDIFYQSMFTCCLEIVLYCYNFPKKFPWILDAVNVEPIHFVKVIELIVRSKDSLFRELIKHLNRIEETVIESLVWRSNSPIWAAIEKSGQEIPKFQDTALPGHLLYNDDSYEHLLQSPGPPSAADRFQSPLSQLCKNLFPSSVSTLQMKKSLGQGGGPDKEEQTGRQGSPESKANSQAASLPRRTGSLSIIFRKFYNLAGVRMQHLCSHLCFDDFELRRKIWTIFEDSIRHTDLIKDRHLDQLLMCAIYVICKAGNITKMTDLFAVIMKFYRLQPQASSSVYRDVLIETTKDGDLISEVRSDLIQFYNSVYVKVMRSYAVKFQPNSDPKNSILLSPLPASRKNLFASNLQVVGNVFVKPLETATTQSGSTFNYYFSRSPSKDLMNINRAINSNGIQGKRLLIDEDGNMPNSKRISNRKVQSLVEDRQRQNASE